MSVWADSYSVVELGLTPNPDIDASVSLYGSSQYASGSQF